VKNQQFLNGFCLQMAQASARIWPWLSCIRHILRSDACNMKGCNHSPSDKVNIKLTFGVTALTFEQAADVAEHAH